MTSISTVSAIGAAPVTTATVASRPADGTATAQEAAKQPGSKEIIARYKEFTDIATDETGKYTLDQKLRALNAAEFLFWSKDHLLIKPGEINKPISREVKEINARWFASPLGDRAEELHEQLMSRFHASTEGIVEYARIARDWFHSLSDDDKKIYTFENANVLTSNRSKSIFNADGTISADRIASQYKYNSVAQYEHVLDLNVEAEERAKASRLAGSSHLASVSAAETGSPSAVAASNAAPAVVAGDQGAGVAQLARSASAATQSLTASLLPLFTTYDASGASAPHHASAESGGHGAHRGGRLFGASPRVTAGGYARRDTIA
ncbi:hypothetical protein K7957_09170 [Sphingomonas yunnanensis]|uniref:hypothetical protein n=1 Tax=Sphingomonas yunnanensis TaxID=310400 RepID=UPI001CA77C58|nr:hypothetical protein [Sphingomonas yunnanensis]MBY9063102.1 hypothetical protein [Sphingomonas yunnanensis]